MVILQRGVKMGRKVRQYTKEFKEEAVRLALKSLSVDNVARELGIPGPTLYCWVNKTKNNGFLHKLDSNNVKSMADLIEENRRLHKALAIAQEEREILKKAAAYFAVHQK
jgi:transposase